MNELQSQMATLFQLLRANGLQLGTGDWLELCRAVNGGFGVGTLERLRCCARLLWATSPEEQRLFDELFDKAVRPVAVEPPAPAAVLPGGTAPHADGAAADDTWNPVQIPDAFPPPTPPPDPMVVQGPTTRRLTQPAASTAVGWLGGSADLAAHTVGWPLDPRELAATLRAGWSRRVVAPDQIDVPRTVDRVARDGFFLEPVRVSAKRRLRLQFLIDNSSSMAPFEPITSLVPDALHRAGVAAECRFAWFRNHPEPRVLPAEGGAAVDVRELVDAAERAGRGLVVVSDAGAARGSDQPSRREAIVTWAHKVQRRGLPLVWLNPCPVGKWAHTSAESPVAAGVFTDELTGQGVRRALRHLRGEPPGPAPTAPGGHQVPTVRPLPDRKLPPIERWLSYHDAGYTVLAMHLALPLSLTPRLAFAIWAEFQRDEHDQLLAAPWHAVPDLLLSTACREVGPGRYELADGARRWLLDQFDHRQDLGPGRRDAVAQFLRRWTEKDLRSPQESTRRMAQAQQWAADAVLDPALARRRLAQELQAERYLDAAPFAWLSRVILATQTDHDPEAQRLSAYAHGLRLHRAGRVEESRHLLQQATTAGPDLAGVRLTPPSATTPTGDARVTMAVFLKDGGVWAALDKQYSTREGFDREFVAPDFFAHVGTLGGRAVRLLILVTPSFEVEPSSRWDRELHNERIDLSLILDCVSSKQAKPSRRVVAPASGLSTVALYQSVRYSSVRAVDHQRPGVELLVPSWRVQHLARQFLQGGFDLTAVAARFEERPALEPKETSFKDSSRVEFNSEEHRYIRELARYYLPLRWEAPDRSEPRKRHAVETAAKLLEHLVAELPTWLRPPDESRPAIYLPAKSPDSRQQPTVLLDHFRGGNTPICLRSPSARRSAMFALEYAYEPTLPRRLEGEADVGGRTPS